MTCFVVTTSLCAAGERTNPWRRPQGRLEKTIHRCCTHFGVMEFLDNLPRKPRVIIQLPSRMPINPTTTFIRTISLAAVAEGFAVTVLPASSIASEVSDRVIHRGLPSLPKLEVALYRANDQRAATQAFAEFLIERFARLSQ